MTSLNIIEQFLNIQIGDKQLKKGKNQETNLKTNIIIIKIDIILLVYHTTNG